MFNLFKKPSINAKLIDKGSKAKVVIKNANAEQTIILLFMAIKQIAVAMKIPHRQLINKILDIDKQVVRIEKRAEKNNRYGKGK